MKKNCVVCGKEFETRVSIARTCGPECSKERHRQTKKAWKAANRVRYREYDIARTKEWRLRNLDRERARSRDRQNQRRLTDPEAVRQYKRSQYVKHRARILAKQKAYRDANASKIKSRSAEYMSRPEVIERNRLRRKAEWAARDNKKRLCSTCGREFRVTLHTKYVCGGECRKTASRKSGRMFERRRRRELALYSMSRAINRIQSQGLISNDQPTEQAEHRTTS